MKLYIITANTYDGGFGAEISLFGIYEAESEAKERQKKLKENTKTQH